MEQPIPLIETTQINHINNNEDIDHEEEDEEDKDNDYVPNNQRDEDLFDFIEKQSQNDLQQ